MSFLKKIFKKKPGGTLFGNLLRGVSHAASGGILGNGANMIPAGTPTAPPPPPTPTQSAISGALVSGFANTPQIQDAAATGIMQKLKDNWVAVVAVLCSLGLGIYLFVTRKGGKKKKKY